MHQIFTLFSKSGTYTLQIVSITGHLMVSPSLRKRRRRYVQMDYAMNYKDCDDRQLVAAIVSNDVEAIKYFFNEKCSVLFAYIMANVFDNNVPKDDLPQELFLYLAQNNWYKVRQFDFRSKLMTWVSVVAVRFFQKKREALIEKTSTTTLNDKMWQDQSTAFYSDRRMDVRAALLKMPNKRYCMVIEYLDLKEVKPEQLAKQMEVTVDNLYNIHRRALVQLRLIMGRKEEYYD